MQDQNFRILSSRVVGLLESARRRAYLAPSRVGNSLYQGEDQRADWRLREAADLIQADKLLDDEQRDLLWRRYGLVQLYVSYAESTKEPLSWQDWLKGADGRRGAQQFPQQELQAARREASAAHAAVIASMKEARRLDHDTTKVPEPCRIVSLTALEDPNEDPLRNLCRQIKQEFGVAWRDKRPKGGTLLVEFIQSSGIAAEKLQRAGFTFSPTRGWWQK